MELRNIGKRHAIKFCDKHRVKATETFNTGLWGSSFIPSYRFLDGTRQFWMDERLLKINPFLIDWSIQEQRKSDD